MLDHNPRPENKKGICDVKPRRLWERTHGRVFSTAQSRLQKRLSEEDERIGLSLWIHEPVKCSPVPTVSCLSSLSVYLSICTSVSLPACLPVCLSAYLSIYLLNWICLFCLTVLSWCSFKSQKCVCEEGSYNANSLEVELIKFGTKCLLTNQDQWSRYVLTTLTHGN